MWWKKTNYMSITKNKNRNIQVTIGCLRWWLMGGHQGLCKGFRWPPRRWVNTSSWWDGWLQRTNRGLEEAGHGQEETRQWQTHYSDNIQALKAARQKGYGKMAAATSAIADCCWGNQQSRQWRGQWWSDGLERFCSGEEETVLVRSRFCADQETLLRGRGLSKRTKAVLQGFPSGERERNIYKKI